MLESMLGKGNTYSLLVRMQTGVAGIEISVFLTKLKTPLLTGFIVL